MRISMIGPRIVGAGGYRLGELLIIFSTCLQLLINCY